MRKSAVILCVVLLAICMLCVGCDGGTAQEPSGPASVPGDSSGGAQTNPPQTEGSTYENAGELGEEDNGEKMEYMYVTVGKNTLKITPESNSSVDALRELLKLGDISYTASDYGGFEKVGNIGHTLPRIDKQIEVTAGDVILYQGNSICLYYGENSWSFTKIGRIEGYSQEELRTLLSAGGGEVDVTLSLKEKTDEGGESKKKILIAYFSCTDNTAGVARQIAEITGGDLYEIQAAVPYTAEDLRYYTGGRADQEQADATARPAISNSVADMESYDFIYLGYPIWHGQAPKIIYTFLESYRLAGKTVAPFCTSHSSGIGSSDTNLHPLASNANWRSGKRFPAGATKNSIAEWVATVSVD